MNERAGCGVSAMRVRLTSCYRGVRGWDTWTHRNTRDVDAWMYMVGELEEEGNERAGAQQADDGPGQVMSYAVREPQTAR